MLLCGVAQAEPENKKKVSAKQAERHCNLSTQERYKNLAKYCKNTSRGNICCVYKSTYTEDESSASFFRQEKERAEAAQLFSGSQNLDAPHKPERLVRHQKQRPVSAPDAVRIAREWEGFNQRKNRQDLIKLLSYGNMKVDPVRIPWCAGFMNAILTRAGYEGTGSLMARSFLGYGIATKYPREGDIVVFSRGKNSSAGHVGFYVGAKTINGVRHIKVLGGNQNKKVSVAYYPANKLLSYRKLG